MEKITLTERERRFASELISRGIATLRDARRIEEQVESAPEEKNYDEASKNHALIYLLGERLAARDIAGGSLNALFGGDEMETIYALESLSKREDIETFRLEIVDKFYEELLKQRDA
jgi:hypothetical protein